jgi:hypothetical protein
MKKFVSLFICGCLFALPATGAEEEKSSVSIDGASYSFIFNWKTQKSHETRRKAHKAHWTGFGFAFSKLGNLSGAELKLDRSYSVILNLLEYNVPFDEHWIMASGLGFDWSRYHFKRNVALQTINGITQFAADPENKAYRDSKFIIYYASIPLILEYQTKFHGYQTFIYGGVEGLVKLYSKSHAEIRTPDRIQETTFKDLNLLPLNYRLTLRASFGGLSIFGYYQPMSMFEKGKGPDIDARGLGMMLNF